MNTTTSWSQAHDRVLEGFSAGWRRPHPHAWDDVLAEDVVFTQPLLRPGTGPAHWHEEARRLLAFAPDLTGEVLSWAARDDVMFIDLRLTATVGGAPVTVRTVDRLRVTPSGRIVRRDASFDWWPVARAVLLRPSAWWRWWRSGVGPLIGRRPLLGGSP
ncbi:nuclear transport factor 2 family protein [Pseudonocardia nigra]|uniref:nuclear transport factor 2 family protein n=1 Tax=Pseudonocardia nigra TaxID=1921578 RepID=UPI001C5E13EF|nr:nuclear transport factor 2 family protein [Pseudonocardia nigra]